MLIHSKSIKDECIHSNGILCGWQKVSVWFLGEVWVAKITELCCDIKSDASGRKPKILFSFIFRLVFILIVRFFNTWKVKSRLSTKKDPDDLYGKTSHMWWLTRKWCQRGLVWRNVSLTLKILPNELPQLWRHLSMSSGITGPAVKLDLTRPRLKLFTFPVVYLVSMFSYFLP